MKVFLCVLFLAHPLFASTFDLRNVNGKKMVSSVKSQMGGTCWTHGTMAAIESNLLMTGNWNSSGQSGEPNLAEYHLDWWNGFNEHHNPDTTEVNGLSVHEGGDYRVASAYLSRGGGPVRDLDAQSYNNPPKKTDSSYRYFYPRDIEWYTVGPNLENIDTVKNAIKTHGVIGTALAWDDAFFDEETSNFYQPPNSNEPPNHAVAIIGWDDERRTQAPKKGAWLVKNSWGRDWGEGGYFWISFYDKVSTRHPQMGAVSFQNVESQKYKQIYSWDLHGWRDTKNEASEAFNSFIAKGSESLTAVSFYTPNKDTEFRIDIYGSFDGQELSNRLSSQEGFIANTGYHTIDLDWNVSLKAGMKFYVAVTLSKPGHAFDKTSDVPVLLGSKSRVTVKSSAKSGESFYRKNGTWYDLTRDDASANFCIKAFSE